VNAKLSLDIPSTFANGLTELRERNRLRVVEAFRCGAPLSQTTISRLTGLSRSTVWTIVRELKEKGLILEQASIESAGRGGRPGTRLLLNRTTTAVGPDVYSSDVTHSSTVHSFQLDQLLVWTLLLAQENARLNSLLTNIAGLTEEAVAPSKGLGRRRRRKESGMSRV
jgi:biotin operon repressor